jgi:hypothetical protein
MYASDGFIRYYLHPVASRPVDVLARGVVVSQDSGCSVEEIVGTMERVPTYYGCAVAHPQGPLAY